jgi:hypothetical protein
VLQRVQVRGGGRRDVLSSPMPVWFLRAEHQKPGIPFSLSSPSGTSLMIVWKSSPSSAYMFHSANQPTRRSTPVSLASTRKKEGEGHEAYLLSGSNLLIGRLRLSGNNGGSSLVERSVSGSELDGTNANKLIDQLPFAPDSFCLRSSVSRPATAGGTLDEPSSQGQGSQAGTRTRSTKARRTDQSDQPIASAF